MQSPHRPRVQRDVAGVALGLPVLFRVAAVAEWLLLAEAASAKKRLLGFADHGAIWLLHHN